MSPVKKTLRQAIESLSDEEARKLLEFANALRVPATASRLRQLFGGDPAFELPPEDSSGFPPVKPVRGTGIPASQLLIRDRR